MDFQRLFLSLIFFFSVYLLWDAYERAQHPVVPQASAQQGAAPGVAAASGVPGVSVPGTSAAPASGVAATQQVPTNAAAAKGRKILVKTDTLLAEINTVGGTLQKLELLQHRAIEDDKPFVLMEKHEGHVYVAETGLLHDGLPDHTAEFTSQEDNVQLPEGKDSVQVKLTATTATGVEVTKTYTFHRGLYQVDVAYEIDNKGKTPISPEVYFQLKRDDSTPAGEAKFVPTHTGPAVYSSEGTFQKVTFSDIEKNKAKFTAEANNGWVAMLQHYFVSAWLPKEGVQRHNYVNALGDKQYRVGTRFAIPAIEPGKTGGASATLYAGPAVSRLDDIAPGLGLTVDYGWLTVIAKPLFSLMTWLHGLAGNWGVAIILLTLLVKLVFFPISAAGFRSMAKMRVVAPKLEKIKQQYGDDRERLHKAMMELYKTEKINPLSGCLPIMLQIPVFMALYWGILYSVELRHAPFIGWIHDLSSPDPYYVLPLIMGGSMLLQSKLNPKPTDPMQAKIMQTMPVVFSVFFFFLPAGLVLYSVVNSVLSMVQQWFITRSAEKADKDKSKN